jgi:hypothetical protein
VLSDTIVRDINAGTGRVQKLGVLKQAPPEGDIVLSFSPLTGQVLFVQGEHHDGEVDLLRRRSHS